MKNTYIILYFKDLMAISSDYKFDNYSRILSEGTRRSLIKMKLSEYGITIYNPYLILNIVNHKKRNFKKKIQMETL